MRKVILKGKYIGTSSRAVVGSQIFLKDVENTAVVDFETLKTLKLGAENGWFQIISTNEDTIEEAALRLKHNIFNADTPTPTTNDGETNPSPEPPSNPDDGNSEEQLPENEENQEADTGEAALTEEKPKAKRTTRKAKEVKEETEETEEKSE